MACSRMWVGVDDDDEASCVEDAPFGSVVLPCIRRIIANSRSFSDLNAASSI